MASDDEFITEVIDMMMLLFVILAFELFIHLLVFGLKILFYLSPLGILYLLLRSVSRRRYCRRFYY